MTELEEKTAKGYTAKAMSQQLKTTLIGGWSTMYCRTN